MTETDVMNQIRAGISDIAVVFRVNVVKGQLKTGQFVSSGVSTGYSDLSGHRKSDGKAIYLEVKTGSGKATPQQLNFLEQMRATGAIAGIVRSVEESRSLILL